MDARVQAESDHRKSEPERRIPASAIRLQPDEVDQLVARYNETRNMRQVAREFRMSRTTVAKHLADRGVATTKSMSAEQIARAVELYADGLSSMVIGKQLGFDNHTIVKALRMSGMRIRPALGK